MNIVKGMGIALAIVLAFGLIEWRAEVIASADLHSGLAAWVQAVGSILALVAAFLIPMHFSKREHQRQKRLAATRVHVRMWRWIEKATFKVFSVNGWDEVNEPEPECDLPSIPFSTSLENITELDPELAQQLLELVERREKILSEAAATAYYEHSINAQPAFEGRSAALILDAVIVLERLANAAGWPDRDLDSRDRDRLEKIKSDFEASQARANAEGADF